MSLACIQQLLHRVVVLAKLGDLQKSEAHIGDEGADRVVDLLASDRSLDRLSGSG